jgi:hypothetical protein
MPTFLKLVPSAAAQTSATPVFPRELALWLERALGDGGVRRGTPPGGAPDAPEEARDAVLRALAQRFYPYVPVGTQAARIHALAATYAFVNWPRDREHTQIPARYRNTPEEYLWAAFKSGAPMPLPRRDLLRILIGAPEGDAG